ncbi:MAG: alpha-N-arabinofuranosidase, partial [Bacteroidales bacterium]|nr:alpha-N-arabinofuranosidase [Bacteroidales bacterium]
SWGCGGEMTPEFYADQYRRYATYCRNFDGNRLYKVASGASDYDYNWTKVLMEKVGRRADAVSLHYYTVTNWNHKGSATDFTDGEYYDIIAKALEVEEVLRNHEVIMDTYDPERRIDLLLDEWGTWFDVEPGTNPGHLFQQNSMRDAIVAAMSLNIFNKHTYRLKMANIAQIVNVLQSMVLTQGDKMLLTPTYHVFRMYRGHQDAVAVPVAFACDTLQAPSGRLYPTLSISASRSADGKLLVTLVNPRLDSAQAVTLVLDALRPKTAAGEILCTRDIRAHNTFAQPQQVAPKPFGGILLAGSSVSLTLPPASIVSVTLQ